MFAGFSFYRLRHERHFVAVGMLFLGFFLWGVHLIGYPFSERFTTLVNAGILFSAVLQLFMNLTLDLAEWSSHWQTTPRGRHVL